ncbi:MAG TPA: hypothetical protein VMW86_09975 [Dehalococcoidales bacterium]|nr:hypothetical protein [Dehalococcoidales bacterium]
MGKLKIEGCPRCKKGAVGIDKDMYGWYEYCIQCGYIRDLPDVIEPASLKRRGETAKADRPR